MTFFGIFAFLYMNKYDTYISMTVSMLSTRNVMWSAHFVCLIFEMAHVREKVGHPCIGNVRIINVKKICQETRKLGGHSLL